MSPLLDKISNFGLLADLVIFEFWNFGFQLSVFWQLPSLLLGGESSQANKLKIQSSLSEGNTKSNFWKLWPSCYKSHLKNKGNHFPSHLPDFQSWCRMNRNVCWNFCSLWLAHFPKCRWLSILNLWLWQYLQPSYLVSPLGLLELLGLFLVSSDFCSSR